MPDPTLVHALREHLLNRSFGAVKFWGLATMRPHDQAYDLVSTHVDGERLDLVFVHASRLGLPGIVSIEAPGGLHLNPQGLTLDHARSLRMDDMEATDSGDSYTIRNAQGTGIYPKAGRPALTIEF